ncbi:MAG: isopenicillin N synthase family oxygenase [Pseudomonadota bacterium]|nr:isopenicillin N synthase family oxygenase [Pseudomonadota bacterium]
MRLQQVPVIDLAPYFEGTPEGKQKVAEAVDQACRDIGFLVITNHQVPQELVDRVYRQSREFFNLPMSEKRKVDRPDPSMVRGYSAVEEEGLSYSLEEAAPGDLKESFSIGPTDVPDDEYHRGAEAGPHFAPNVWPEAIAGFKETYSEYFAAMSSLAASIMRIFALALDLDEQYFDDKIDKEISMLRTLSYPLVKPEDIKDGQMRAGAHSDYGSMTIVKPDNSPGGLQVKNLKGEWVDVPYVEGAFVVNIGDLMMNWTNDQWISTLHRVVNPPADVAAKEPRQSIVFFHQPNYDAIIECLPGILKAGEKPLYEPISSGDHLKSKFVKQTTFGGGVEVA